jgi:hypothetical protein
MKTQKRKPSSAGGSKLNLHLAWGPEDATANRDAVRLTIVSATVSNELASWLRSGSPKDLDRAKSNFLVRSFLCAMRDAGWNPLEPKKSSEPLHFCLASQDEFFEIVVSVQSHGKHLLHFDIFDGSRN